MRKLFQILTVSLSSSSSVFAQQFEVSSKITAYDSFSDCTFHQTAAVTSKCSNNQITEDKCFHFTYDPQANIRLFFLNTLLFQIIHICFWDVFENRIESLNTRDANIYPSVRLYSPWLPRNVLHLQDLEWIHWSWCDSRVLSQDDLWRELDENYVL